MAERARRSVGATVGGRVPMGPPAPKAWPPTIAGGTHHAYADKGGGFCVFNDAAVAPG
jgi:acetoin utilization deacetylase AcuC-like enzyme